MIGQFCAGSYRQGTVCPVCAVAFLPTHCPAFLGPHLVPPHNAGGIITLPAGRFSAPRGITKRT